MPSKASSEAKVARKREYRQTARDAGMPPPVSPAWRRKRNECGDSLERFCLTFFAPRFYLPFSPDHLRVIARLERIVREGGLLALAMPRGAGKTEIVKAAALWAILYGHRRFVVVVGATATDASRTIEDLKVSLAHNEELHKAFPEATHYPRDLEGIVHRARVQTIGDKPSGLLWTKDMVRLAWVPKARCAGAVIRTAGLTGAIRGMSAAGPDGETIRPDLVLLDDPQTREALDVDTPIPTPGGFVRMGDLRVGDTVFDECGSPCRVTGVSEVYAGRPCYRVLFDDGASVVADGGHLWNTSTQLQRTNQRRKVAAPSASWAARPQCRPRPFASTRTTDEIRQTLVGEGGRNNHSIPLAGPLSTRDCPLPIPPYTLGVWLGDGDHAQGRVTSADPEILARVRADGFEVGPPCRKPGNEAAAYTVYGLRPLLRAAGVLRDKHVPAAYWFASRGQRLALLQGLMDTDGWAGQGQKGQKGVRCGFSNTNRRIIDAAMHLCRSLGIKARCAPVRQTKPNAAPAWTVSFVTEQPVFHLPRKLVRLPAAVKPTVRRRYVAAVESVDSRPVRCIAVDSPSRLYLCGEAMVPTHNSATSPSQSDDRERIVRGDVLGLAGPTKSIAAVMPCTVICEGDLADRLLDRDLNPQWHGERTRLVESFPTDTAAWDMYFELRADALRAGGDARPHVEYYKANRQRMDAGCVLAWPERFDPARYVSAVEEAMCRRHDDPEAFAAEMQNAPLLADASAECRELHAADIVRRLTNLPRGVVPREATRVTAFADVGGKLLHWAVVAWDEKFGGAVLDYGAYPRQSRPYFTADDAAPTLIDLYPGRTEGQRVYLGLSALAHDLFGRSFDRDGGGESATIGQFLVDSRWLPDTIHQFVRESPPSFRALLVPSKGYAPSERGRAIDDWQRKEGERAGPSWRLGPGSTGRKGLTFDPDFWKTFLADRLTTDPGSGGSLRLFGSDPREHRMLADHLTSEYATRVTTPYRTYDSWEQKPGGHENHLFDCLVGCCVGASVMGLAWSASGGPVAAREPRKRIKLSEIYAQKHGAGVRR